MTPINKLSGNICLSCRTIISNKSGRQFLCPECQEKALQILIQLGVSDDVVDISDAQVKAINFLKEVDCE